MAQSPQRYELPDTVRHICIEGVIGAGKTTLCSLLQKKLNARLVLEEAEENPFLAQFYRNRKDFAFQTQLWFLVSRYRQLSQAFGQQDLFHSVTLCDYMFAKDRIFAAINLDDNELNLYDTIAKNLSRDVAHPDLVVYLQVSTEVLLKHIEKRGRPFEYNMDRNYIETLNEAYNHFFFHFTDTPLLIINTSDIDFVTHPEHLDELLDQIVQAPPGVNFYKPMG
jgi:deoxyadenosine/deoxycytidine kinase